MSKLDEFLEYLNCDCSDGNCIFRPSTKKGMVTNGGCKCSGDYNKCHELARLMIWLYCSVKERLLKYVMSGKVRRVLGCKCDFNNAP